VGDVDTLHQRHQHGKFYLKLDNNPYEVAFLNGIYDVKNNAFNNGIVARVISQ
jgi:hypothetical protein